VVLTVADNGVGLPPGAEERIFDRFYRADPSRAVPAPALGLAIADWIVREHGGTVSRPTTTGRGDLLGGTAGRPRPDEPTIHLALPRQPAARDLWHRNAVHSRPN